MQNKNLLEGNKEHPSPLWKSNVSHVPHVPSSPKRAIDQTIAAENDSSLATTRLRKKNKRRFNFWWQKDHTWLIYNFESDLMRCELCLKAKRNNQFARQGSRNFKTSALIDHEKSNDHQWSIKYDQETQTEHSISSTEISVGKELNKKPNMDINSLSFFSGTNDNKDSSSLNESLRGNLHDKVNGRKAPMDFAIREYSSTVLQKIDKYSKNRGYGYAPDGTFSQPSQDEPESREKISKSQNKDFAFSLQKLLEYSKSALFTTIKNGSSLNLFNQMIVNQINSLTNNDPFLSSIGRLINSNKLLEWHSNDVRNSILTKASCSPAYSIIVDSPLTQFGNESMFSGLMSLFITFIDSSPGPNPNLNSTTKYWKTFSLCEISNSELCSTSVCKTHLKLHITEELKESKIEIDQLVCISLCESLSNLPEKCSNISPVEANESESGGGSEYPYSDSSRDNLFFRGSNYSLPNTPHASKDDNSTSNFPGVLFQSTFNSTDVTLMSTDFVQKLRAESSEFSNFIDTFSKLCLFVKINFNDFLFLTPETLNILHSIFKNVDIFNMHLSFPQIKKHKIFAHTLVIAFSKFISEIVTVVDQILYKDEPSEPVNDIHGTHQYNHPQLHSNREYAQNSSDRANASLPNGITNSPLEFNPIRSHSNNSALQNSNNEAFNIGNKSSLIYPYFTGLSSKLHDYNFLAILHYFSDVSNLFQPFFTSANTVSTNDINIKVGSIAKSNNWAASNVLNTPVVDLSTQPPSANKAQSMSQQARQNHNRLGAHFDTSIAPSRYEINGYDPKSNGNVVELSSTLSLSEARSQVHDSNSSIHQSFEGVSESRREYPARLESLVAKLNTFYIENNESKKRPLSNKIHDSILNDDNTIDWVYQKEDRVVPDSVRLNGFNLNRFQSLIHYNNSFLIRKNSKSSLNLGEYVFKSIYLTNYKPETTVLQLNSVLTRISKRLISDIKKRFGYKYIGLLEPLSHIWDYRNFPVTFEAVENFGLSELANITNHISSKKHSFLNAANVKAEWSYLCTYLYHHAFCKQTDRSCTCSLVSNSRAKVPKRGDFNIFQYDYSLGYVSNMGTSQITHKPPEIAYPANKNESFGLGKHTSLIQKLSQMCFYMVFFSQELGKTEAEKSNMTYDTTQNQNHTRNFSSASETSNPAHYKNVVSESATVKSPGAEFSKDSTATAPTANKATSYKTFHNLYNFRHLTSSNKSTYLNKYLSSPSSYEFTLSLTSQSSTRSSNYVNDTNTPIFKFYNPTSAKSDKREDKSENSLTTPSFGFDNLKKLASLWFVLPLSRISKIENLRNNIGLLFTSHALGIIKNISSKLYTEQLSKSSLHSTGDSGGNSPNSRIVLYPNGSNQVSPSSPYSSWVNPVSPMCYNHKIDNSNANPMFNSSSNSKTLHSCDFCNLSLIVSTLPDSIKSTLSCILDFENYECLEKVIPKKAGGDTYSTTLFDPEKIISRLHSKFGFDSKSASEVLPLVVDLIKNDLHLLFQSTVLNSGVNPLFNNDPLGESVNSSASMSLMKSFVGAQIVSIVDNYIRLALELNL